MTSAKDKFVRDFVAAWDKMMSLNASIVAARSDAQRAPRGAAATASVPARSFRTAPLEDPGAAR
jgi:hypothetical protein